MSNPLIILAGVTCGGKSHLAKKLKSELGMREIISYTTRPQRENEVNHKDYHFVGLDEFTRILPAMQEYEEVRDGVFYGSLASDYSNSDFIILTPKMALDIKIMLDRECLLVFIDCDDDTIYQRLTNSDRDDKEERFANILKERKYIDHFDIVLNTSEMSKGDSFVEFKKIWDGSITK